MLDPVIARKQWRTLEPFHGMIYFVPEADERYQAIGLEPGRMGYFASRSAAMGPVPAEVVIATFFNFNPDIVRSVIPRAWGIASPEAVVGARMAAVDAALTRLLGNATAGGDMVEAAGLARVAAQACDPAGRPLFGGHASLPWPDEPHLVLWHAITLLREFRGDGHVAAMVAEGVADGCEALVLHAATGDIPAGVLQASRAWPVEKWEATVERLGSRGWIERSGGLTEAGRAHRDRVEALTDRAALAPWEALGADECDRLRALVRPWSRLIADSGTFGA